MVGNTLTFLGVQKLLHNCSNERHLQTENSPPAAATESAKVLEKKKKRERRENFPTRAQRDAKNSSAELRRYLSTFFRTKKRMFTLVVTRYR